jgi:hypothetical protein
VDAISKQPAIFFHDVFMLYYISKCREPTRLRAQMQRRTTIATAAMLRGDVFDDTSPQLLTIFEQNKCHETSLAPDLHRNCFSRIGDSQIYGRKTAQRERQRKPPKLQKKKPPG